MGKIIPCKHTPEAWELDGRILAHGDWITVRYWWKWMLGKVDVGYSPPLVKLENGADLKLKAGMEAHFIRPLVGSTGDTEIHKWTIEKGERAEALKRLKQYLNNAKSLTICDKYFFVPTRNVADMSGFIEILPLPTLKNLEVFCGSVRLYDTRMEKDIRRKLEPGISVKVFLQNVIHDRFWIVDHERAYSVGTSFNGIGERLSLLLDIPPADLQRIERRLQQIRNQSPA